MFYGWEPLRVVSRPGSLQKADYINAYSSEHTDGILTDSALSYIKQASPDFVFLYMVETDEKGGHACGWMSKTYLDYINHAITNVQRVIRETNGEYTVIITADHGGHENTHGCNIEEDMTIPIMFFGENFQAGKELKNISLLDIAPTIAEIMSVPIPAQWHGKSILSSNNKR